MTAQKKQKLDEPAAEPAPELKIAEAVADVDAAIEAAEDEIELVTIKFRETEFTLPKLMDEWDTEACLAMNEGNYVLAAKLLLGRGQWAQLMALGDKRKDIRAFLRVFADVVDEECIA